MWYHEEEIIALKKSLTTEEIESFMVHFGSLPCKKDKNGNFLFSTICHCGNKQKLYYYPNSYNFHCYTDCNESFDIFGLIKKIKQTEGKEYSFKQSVDFIKSFFHKDEGLIDYQYETNTKVVDFYILNKFLNKETKDKPLKEYDSHILNYFLNYYHISWINENISPKIMKNFNIKFYPSKNAIVIPHYNINNKLIGIRVRNLSSESTENGYKYLPLFINGAWYTHNTGHNLYGLNINKNDIQKSRTVILFEGEKSVLKHNSWFNIKNSTAVSGSNISTIQRNLLIDLNITNLIIGFDKEYTNKQELLIYLLKILKKIEYLKQFFNIYILIDENNLLKYKDSPIDQGKDVFNELLKNKKSLNEMKSIIEKQRG